MISLKTHSVLDYIAGIFLVVSPKLFGFAELPEAQNLFLFLGWGLIAYSLLTQYKLSLFKVIPIGVHMGLDLFTGLIVMSAPFILEYQELLTAGQYGFHLLTGLGFVGLVVVTRMTKTVDMTQLKNENWKRDDQKVA